MHNKSKPFVFLMQLSLLLVLTGPANARIFCWTNDEGIRECGDTIPPEYSQKGREIISEGGMVIDERERAMTDEEIEAHKRQVALEKEKLRQEEERAKQDQILLYTYTNIEDIELTRDGKIQLLETSIGLANKRNEKIRAELDKREQQAATLERDGKNIPENLVEDISSLRRQINENNEYIYNKKQEIEDVTLEYAEAMERFKYLKGIEEEPVNENETALMENSGAQSEEPVNEEETALMEDSEAQSEEPETLEAVTE